MKCEASLHIGLRGGTTCELTRGHSGLHLSRANGSVTQWRPVAQNWQQYQFTERLMDLIAEFSEGAISAEDAWQIAIDASDATHAAIEAEGK